MGDPEDYCELCDLPRSQCIHGRPPPAPPPKPVKAPSRPRQSGTRTRTVSPAAPLKRRWTPPEVFKPLIVAVLEEAGGELEAEDVFLGLEILAEDRLLPGDSETTPEGELRWRYAARRARVALLDEGVMVKGRPGLWQLAADQRRP
jgi:hypothetical protein